MATGSKKPSGNDPRKLLGSEELEKASAAAFPQVARGASNIDLGLIGMVAAALAIGAVTWVSLTSHKPAPASAPVAGTAVQTPPVRIPAQVPPPASSAPPVGPAMLAASPAGEANSHAPVMIIDNSKIKGSPGGGRSADAGATPAVNSANNALLSSDEQFAARIAGTGDNKATRISNPSQIVPQGAVIPAVLETSLNSDLPGFARALVSREVKSFDGSKVLIPRGSRLIGQYKSGLASGVTRAYIIWNRLIRPDGVSIQLSSPATDQLGQAGLAGDVDTHFAERFGAAMLLSIVSGLSNTGSSNTIVIGTSSGAQSAASDALSANAKIPPTIKVAQGTAIQVFVARDLDFGE